MKDTINEYIAANDLVQDLHKAFYRLSEAQYYKDVNNWPQLIKAREKLRLLTDKIRDSKLVGLPVNKKQIVKKLGGILKGFEYLEFIRDFVKNKPEDKVNNAIDELDDLITKLDSSSGE